MKRTWVVAALAVALLSGGAMARAEEDGWVKYEDKTFGFSMLMPEGTRYVEKETEGGWGELWAEYEGVKFYALAKLGEKATAEEIEKVGVKLTGIPSKAWKTINKGENEGGWIWYRTVEASDGKTLVIGDYGTGKKGSYLLVLVTTEKDYEEHKADYATWYQSIRLK